MFGFSLSKWFRDKTITLTSQRGTLVARPKLALVLGFLATAITVLAALSWFHRNQVSEARSAQVILDQIAVLSRNINTLTFTALQEKNLNPVAEAKVRTARQELPKAVLAAHLHAYHTTALETVWPALDDYIMSASQQWILMQVGDFDEAKQVNFQKVSPPVRLDAAPSADCYWSRRRMGPTC